MNGQTRFNTEYIISLLIALLATYGIAVASPKLNPVITYAIIPLAVAYATLQILNATVPGINRSGSRVSAYIENRTLGEINDMGYIQVFPPLMAVTILVFVLLFTRNLS